MNTRRQRKSRDESSESDSDVEQRYRSNITRSSRSITANLRRKFKMLREIVSHNESLEPKLNAAPRISQRTTRRCRRRITARQKRVRSPGSDLDDEQDIRRSNTARSSQQVIPRG